MDNNQENQTQEPVEQTAYPGIEEQQQQDQSQPQENQQIDYQEQFTNNQVSSDNALKIMEEYNPFEKREDGSEIEINIGESRQKDDTFSKFTVYQVIGQDENGPFDCYRRYNDFYELRKILVQRWPGCFIPPIPPKKAGQSNDISVVEDRKKFLNNFVLKVSLRRHLYYSEEFQLFLRNKDQELGKILEKMQKYKPKDIIEKYKEQFSQLNGKEITQNLLLELNNFLGYLKKSKAQLQKFKDTARSIAHLKKQYNTTVSVLNDNLLPEYERSCLSQYTQGDQSQLIFNNETNSTQLQEFRQQVRDVVGINSFTYISDMIQYEYRDCEAFIEAIEQKDYYEKLKNKLQSKIRDQQDELLSLTQGKKTFKSLFKSGDTEQQKHKLELEINCNTAEAENTATLIDLITGILGFIELDLFKQGKVRTYHKVMQNSAQLELISSSKMQDLYKQIGLESENLLNQQQE